jgi:Zn-dependent peptidase ImmA (M78 family)
MIMDLLNQEITEDEFMELNNIRVVYTKLPKKIYGFIHKYRDINLIIINWNISKEKKKETLIHEFAHFELNHLDKDFLDFKIENVEDEADKYVKFILSAIIE